MEVALWVLLFIFGLLILGKDNCSDGDNWRDGPSDWLLHEHNEKEFEYELKAKYEK